MATVDKPTLPQLLSGLETALWEHPVLARAVPEFRSGQQAEKAFSDNGLEAFQPQARKMFAVYRDHRRTWLDLTANRQRLSHCWQYLDEADSQKLFPFQVMLANGLCLASMTLPVDHLPLLLKEYRTFAQDGPASSDGSSHSPLVDSHPIGWDELTVWDQCALRHDCGSYKQLRMLRSEVATNRQCSLKLQSQDGYEVMLDLINPRAYLNENEPAHRYHSLPLTYLTANQLNYYSTLVATRTAAGLIAPTKVFGLVEHHQPTELGSEDEVFGWLDLFDYTDRQRVAGQVYLMRTVRIRNNVFWRLLVRYHIVSHRAGEESLLKMDTDFYHTEPIFLTTPEDGPRDGYLVYPEPDLHQATGQITTDLFDQLLALKERPDHWGLFEQLFDYQTLVQPPARLLDLFTAANR